MLIKAGADVNIGRIDKGAEKGKITRLKDIKSIDAIELILKGLFENYTKAIVDGRKNIS